MKKRGRSREKKKKWEEGSNGEEEEKFLHPLKKDGRNGEENTRRGILK